MDLEVANLSKREAQILQRIAEGETSWQTASNMGLSVETIKSHKRNIYHKLKAKNSAHAVYLWLIQGDKSGQP